MEWVLHSICTAFQLPLLDTLTVGSWSGPASEASERGVWGLRPARRHGSWGGLQVGMIFGSWLSSPGRLSCAEAPQQACL